MGILESGKGRIGLASVLVAAVALAAVAVGSWIGFAPSTDRARRAYVRRDWQGAEAIASKVLERGPEDPEALRVRARALARLGRPRESIALFARLGGARLEAEDLQLIGEEATRQSRPALADLAVETASRLDPSHLETREALDRLRRGPRPSGGSDRLLAVPDRATLSELIVGLAVAEPGAGDGGGDPMLDRLLTRERSTFLKLGTPSAARKLLARVALEDGQSRPARDWLAGGDDPETHWLLSRVALIDGDRAEAKVELSQAGRFGLDDPMAPEPSRYVGAARCAGCHAEIYRSQQSSHHSATIARGDGLRGVPLPKAEVVDPENPAVSHRFERLGDEVRVASKVDGATLEAVVDYAIGSGNHGVTMLSKDPDGRHRSLRISYYSRGQHWGLTSGFEPKPVDPASYIGLTLNDASFRNCLNCHTTRFVSERAPPGPESQDRGIGCERCHGPGDHHVRAMEAGLDQPAIARPRLASPPARLKLCAQCHGSDGVIPPADPRFIRFQAATLPYSRCVSESGGKLDCVSCHDPHRDVETSASVYESRCLACHGEDRDKKGATIGSAHRIEAVSASRCPVNPSTGCVGCHMPKVDNVMPFMSFTDHHIRAHRPAGTARQVPPDRGTR